jgi:hypothetical protein
VSRVILTFNAHVDSRRGTSSSQVCEESLGCINGCLLISGRCFFFVLPGIWGEFGFFIGFFTWCIFLLLSIGIFLRGWRIGVSMRERVFIKNAGFQKLIYKVTNTRVYVCESLFSAIRSLQPWTIRTLSSGIKNSQLAHPTSSAGSFDRTITPSPYKNKPHPNIIIISKTISPYSCSSIFSKL